jgi:hypothetical protein
LAIGQCGAYSGGAAKSSYGGIRKVNLLVMPAAEPDSMRELRAYYGVLCSRQPRLRTRPIPAKILRGYIAWKATGSNWRGAEVRCREAA